MSKLNPPTSTGVICGVITPKDNVKKSKTPLHKINSNWENGKINHRPTKIAKRRKTQNLTPQKSLKLGKRKNTQNLTYEKPSKLTKRENLTPQKQLKTTKQEKSKNNQQQIMSKNK